MGQMTFDFKTEDDVPEEPQVEETKVEKKLPEIKKEEKKVGNLLKDLWEHVKEWAQWKMKDWIKAAIVAIVVLWVISWMTGGAA